MLSLALAIYLPSLFLYIIHPGHCWVMGILSIGFPYTWLGMTAVVLLAFWLHRKAGWILLICWAAGWPIMRNVWALNWAQDFPTALKSDSTRQVRQQVAAMLRKHQPQVLLLQDFQEITSPRHYSNIAFLRDTLGYRYMLLAPYYNIEAGWGRVQEGSAIFSKIPFDTSGHFMYGGRSVSEQIAWADIRFQGRTLRCVSTHLFSMNLNTPKGQPDPLYYYQRPDSAVITSGDVIRKLRHYQPYHVQQAMQLRHFLDSISHPLVLGIDMNSVPSSWVYRHISRGLQDVFFATGWGWGRSYHSRLPNLRIDYLFTGLALANPHAITIPVSFSDHYPILADLQWR
jgi:endonuclease/exonuclease/phosphatase family metal-dependent hydrolase